MGRQRLDESPDADIFQKVAYEWTQGEVKHTLIDQRPLK